MTLWSAASPKMSFALLVIIFVILSIQLFYLLWMFDQRTSKLWLANAVWFTVLFFVLIALYDSQFLYPVPLWMLWSITALSAIFTAITLFYSVKKNKNRITRASIKNAMDDLPVAGCYFTSHGRVKLCNKQMYRLYHAMTGRDLQSLSELHAAMAKCPKSDMKKGHDDCYVLPDGSIWSYTEREMTPEDGRHYTESIFINITELCAVNEELLNDNQELEHINHKLQKMYVRAEDRIREREYLTFKMKIHDDIGRSLAIIRKVLQNELPTGDIEKQIKTLSIAAGTLVYSQRTDSDDPYDRLLTEAMELGVEVCLSGMLPLEPTIYDLVVKAIRECVTNCVRHAHGTTVSVQIIGLPGGYTVMITNDGEKPKGKITEGCGLSNLRKSIENAGGEMTVSHYPMFVLKLTFMREEMEL